MADPTAWVPAHDAQWLLQHPQEALAEVTGPTEAQLRSQQYHAAQGQRLNDLKLSFDTTGNVLKDAALAKLLTECCHTCIFRSTLRDAVNRRWAHGGKWPLTDYYVETLEPNQSLAPPEYPALSMMWLLGATYPHLAERLAELTVARAIWKTVAVNVRANWNNVNRRDVEQRRIGRPGYAGHVDVGILDRVGQRKVPAQQAAMEAAGQEGGAGQGGQTGAVQQNPAAAVGPTEDWRLFDSPEPGQPGHSPQVPMLEIARPNRPLPLLPKVEGGSPEETRVKVEAEAEGIISGNTGGGARVGHGAGFGAGALTRQSGERRTHSPKAETAKYRERN